MQEEDIEHIEVTYIGGPFHGEVKKIPAMMVIMKISEIRSYEGKAVLYKFGDELTYYFCGIVNNGAI